MIWTLENRHKLIGIQITCSSSPSSLSVFHLKLLDNDAPFMELVLDALILHKWVLLNNRFCFIHRSCLKHKYSASPFRPVASSCSVSFGNQVLNVGFMSGDVLIEVGLIDNTFFNFDQRLMGYKPRPGRAALLFDVTLEHFNWSTTNRYSQITRTP